MQHTAPISVLLVDDSPLVRTALGAVLAAAPDIRVAGLAKDPYEARDLILQHRPDVIVLDTHMPRMDGPTFLKKLKIHYPVPVIMLVDSADVPAGLAWQCSALGAVEVLAKPTDVRRDTLRALGPDLLAKVRAAAVSGPAASPPISSTAVPGFAAAGLDSRRFLIVLGASTGGTEAIREFLKPLPADFPPIAAVQHMPEGFTASFAEHLDRVGAIRAREAGHGDALQPGIFLLARGGKQLRLRQTAGRIVAEHAGSEPVNRHAPSVDVLFESALKIVGPRIIAILLTGMGGDGARGLLALRRAGALTIAQDRISSVVYGMPKVAVDLGAAMLQCPPAEIGRRILIALHRDAADHPVRSATVSTPRS